MQMMASGCAAATISSTVNSPVALVCSSSSVCSAQSHSSLPSTEKAAKCFPSRSRCSSFVRRTRRRTLIQEQRFRIYTTLAGRRSTRCRLDTFCVPSPPSSHFFAVPVSKESGGDVQKKRDGILGSSLGLEIVSTRQTGSFLWGQQCRQQRRPRVKEDDFEIDDDGGFDAMDVPGLDEDEEEDLRDYETEYETPTGYRPLSRELDSFINIEREMEETVVDWKINEEEFHKISLFTCDFFIKKIPDPDDDVYDFREMYVTSPDTDIYAIPKVDGNIPNKPVRCTLSNHEIIRTTEPPVDEPRSPLAKTEMEVMKVFLMKHLKDRRSRHEHFILDFEEIYVIDTKTRSFHRADVKVEVSGGVNRDRSTEVLIVRDGGTNFRIIPEEDAKSPDEIVQAVHWEKTREAMENYLRGFRDYEVSNWF